METTATKTMHKEIHPEQANRVEAQKRMARAKNGELPPNEDITKGINHIQTAINKDNDKLSTTGQTVNKDINAILNTTKQILNDKNEGELLQKTYYHSHQEGSNKSYSERISELKQIIAGGDRSKTRAEAKENVNSLATIVKLAILSPEFRESINDSANIINQLLKTRSDKNEEKQKSKTGELETKTSRDTSITEKNIRDDGVVEACVVESKVVSTIAHKEEKEATSEEKRARQERREEKLIERLVDLAQTLHNNSEYRNSITFLIESSGKLKKYTKEKQSSLKEKKLADKGNENDETIKHHKELARLNGKEFIGNWIGDDFSLDRLITQINFLQEESKTDDELKNLLAGWKKWCTATIRDSDYVNNKEKVREDVKELIANTRSISKRYKKEISVIRHEVVFINKAIQRDDSLLQLRDNFAQLSRDIIKDSNGQPTLKPELLGDAQILIGSLIDTIKYIPLPPIRKCDEKMEVEVENIVLNATDVTPSNIRFMVQTDTDKSVDGTRQHKNSFLIEFSKIRAHLTCVNFFVDKKVGFPKITERGLADIDLGGSGLSVKIEIVPKFIKDGNDVHSVFHAKTVACSIGKLKIHLRETTRDGLFKLLSPIINMVAKKKIEVGIANYIQENMNKMNDLAAKQASTSTQRAKKELKSKE
mmetsp:Transcript_13585/g.21402  ORF Transcript_13585/g.21402 Transcript_13585/m.21402 type:complete len:653 (-) Transcript_13585:12-1970(-)